MFVGPGMKTGFWKLMAVSSFGFEEMVPEKVKRSQFF
jgi:hypothetical protein